MSDDEKKLDKEQKVTPPSDNNLGLGPVGNNKSAFRRSKTIGCISYSPRSRELRMNEKKYRLLDTSIKVSEITDIDTKDRTFRASVEVTVRWSPNQKQRETLDKLMKEEEDEKLHAFLKKVKYPKLIPGNGREIHTMYKTTEIDDVVIAIQKRWLSPKPNHFELLFYSVQQLDGLWQMDKDRGELGSFPFDKHTLPIYLTTTTSKFDRFRLKLDECTTDRETCWVQDKVIFLPSSSHAFDCCMAHLWTWVKADQTKRTYDGGLSVHVTALRRWLYYLKHVLLFVMIQSLLLAPGYAINVEKVGERLEYFVTLLLAQTALLFFVKDSLPKLKYYSILDEYIMWNYILTMVCNAQAAAMKSLPLDTAQSFDRQFLIGVACALSMLNISYLFKSTWTYYKNYVKRYKMKIKIEEEWKVVGDQSNFAFVEEKSGCCSALMSKCRKKRPWKMPRSLWDGGPCVVYKSGAEEDLCPNPRWQDDEFDAFAHNTHTFVDRAVILFGEHATFDTDEFHRQNQLNEAMVNQKDGNELEVKQRKAKADKADAKSSGDVGVLVEEADL